MMGGAARAAERFPVGGSGFRGARVRPRWARWTRAGGARATIALVTLALAAGAAGCAGPRHRSPGHQLPLQPQTGSTSARTITDLDAGWRFIRSDVPGAEAPEFNDSGWEPVTLPHTYNAQDGDIGGAYYRGPAWYRRVVDAPDPLLNRHAYLQFDGAALAADVWVNGRHAGRHEGGYAAFRMDVTGLLHSGRNVVAVRVDNSKRATVAPLGGDFTVFGGLYRSVHLLVTDELHIDLLDYGGPGVYATASNVTSEHAILSVTVRIRNDRAVTVTAAVHTEVLDAHGARIARIDSDVEVPAGTTTPVTGHAVLERPHLWDGRNDPYLYQVTAQLTEAEVASADPALGRARAAQVTGPAPAAAVLDTAPVLDAVTVPLGIRSIRINPSTGFMLNGHYLPVHGVNLFHSGRPGRGLAVNDADIDEDMRIIAELGATGVRFVHFQHPQRAYEDADRTGLVVWTEIPLNTAVEGSPAFEDNIEQQLRELIRQNYNHPSVVVWGLGNELGESDSNTHRVLAGVQETAAAEDPTRPTTYAHCCLSDTDVNASRTDVIAYNRYYGWYTDDFGKLGAWADELHARVPSRAFAVSEYGAGASILQQEDPSRRPVPASHWHPEQYQSLFHEASWRQLRERPYLWATFVWAAFDLASNGRDEGDRAGINDKGLVTYDRAIRKDAYYWYQANWTEPPMVYVTSRRYTNRTKSAADVKVYTNTDSVALTVNGRRLPTQAPSDHVAIWKDVALAPGPNRIEVTGSRGALQVQDAVTWTLAGS